MGVLRPKKRCSGTKEEHVLDEVRQAGLAAASVTRSGADHQVRSDGGGLCGQVSPQAHRPLDRVRPQTAAGC